MNLNGYGRIGQGVKILRYAPSYTHHTFLLLFLKKELCYMHILRYIV